MCASVSTAYVYGYSVCVWCVQMSEETVRFSEVEVTGICEPLHRCWEFNTGPLEEQHVLLDTEPSLQPLAVSYIREQAIIKKSLNCVSKKIENLHFSLNYVC